MKSWSELACAGALAAVVGLALAFQPSARSAAPPPAGADTGNSFVVQGARVFDGERDLGVANVLVRDGMIETVAADAQVPQGLPVVDGSGKTLLPGLIDAHVHAWGEAQRDLLRFGVTSALDMHGDAARLPALRTQRDATANGDRADLWAAGFAITAPGGHGTQYGFPVPTVDAGTDIDAFIGERVDEGADFIKLIVEDLSAYGLPQRLPTLSPMQVAQVVAAAHARDRRAVAHVAKLEDARMAIDAGADGLVHVFADAVADEAFVGAMRARDAFVVPTLAVVASMAGSGEGKALAGDARLRTLFTAQQTGTLAADFGPPNPQRLQRALDSVRLLHAAGVDILAGSDAPNPGTAHGASLHHELALLVRAGLTPAQALAAATSLPAKRFGLAQRGRIAPGMRADLVLVDGDPLDDIAATRAIDTVWKNGHRVAREPAAAAAAPTPAAAAPDDTLVSDFDGDAIEAAFGSWMATTDQMAGGASQVEHALVEGGAGGSRGALRIGGEIRPGFAYPWAGVMFFPAAQPMQPVDLSARRELVFQVRGDGRTYSAMLFSGPSMQGMPSVQAFTAGPQWREIRLPLSAFAGGDLSRVRGIAFTAGAPQGAFEFRIDRVELR
ncbi:amidohydrolase family protein [Luteimonas viscosa]|uniref:Amidohydrolase family protein n=1 Tax=Luteimonas viscosa TaxID=1132694 RepID=A0A5D4XQS3_9GAMM|nr:CIA30 family protein [Luteimonas viscosa]TYT27037.1 amidohydrolase family protein [Luteimonas viscosa]